MSDAPRPGVPGPVTQVTPIGPATFAAGRRDDLWLYVSGRRGTPTDWALVVLAWLALVPNVWLLFWHPATHGTTLALQFVDLALEVLIGLSICWRWLRFPIGRAYLRSHWWEIPALFPLIVPTVGEWRWVLSLVLVARLVRVIDRTDNVVHDRITAAVVTRFSDPIVDSIRRPITVAVLDEVIDVIRTGTYAANIKAAIDENHDQLEALVLDLVRQDPTAGKLKYLPFHDDIVQLVSETVLRLVDGALDDPRTTELISDIIRNSATQVRAAVRARS